VTLRAGHCCVRFLVFRAQVGRVRHDGVMRRADVPRDDAVSVGRRKKLGAWYTPEALIDAVLDATLGPILRDLEPGTNVSVLDPSCGDGRFLVAAARRITDAGGVPVLTGADIDSGARAAARQVLGESAEILGGDARRRRWGARRFDVVVGNPPFLSQLAAATARGGRSSLGGGPYADAAVEFLAMSLRLARPDVGRVGLVLPLSITATRDAADVRDAALRDAALTWFWFSRRPVFDAQIRTCAVSFHLGARQGRIRRQVGPAFETAPPLPAGVLRADARSGDRPDGTWSVLVRDQLGVPAVPELATSGLVLGDRAMVTADFRDEYYGLVGAVSDEGEGPPLVTSGLIEPGRSEWGRRPTRFAKSRYDAPRVRLESLDASMRAWSVQRLVPKVLTASQTRIIEAVVDAHGEWLPSVPVVCVVPLGGFDVWELGAVLTSPVASAWLAARSSGSGLTAGALRVSAPVLAGLPLPAGDLRVAVEHLRAGSVLDCGAAVDAAYGLDEGRDQALLSWWSGRAARPARAFTPM
jgi:N-6 DNA Methylase